MVYNTSAQGLTAVSSFSIWPLTAIVFIAIIVALFLAIKNFRKFIYGSVITGVAVGVGKLSFWIAKQKVSGDGAPFNVVMYSLAFIVASIIIGHIVSKTKFIKDFEKDVPK